VAASVAPGQQTLGVMLPATALHHLLVRDAACPLVMTSGNSCEEPIVYRDEEALWLLGAIADRLLVHDRPIHMRADDSVVRTVAVGGVRQPLMIRRARGYVPAPLALPVAARREILACGAELKATLCLAKGGRAWVSQHIGDLRDAEAMRSYRHVAESLCRLFDVNPALVAHDMHPDYLSTSFARELEDVELIAVQHHHAHLAAVLAEHGRDSAALA